MPAVVLCWMCLEQMTPREIREREWCERCEDSWNAAQLGFRAWQVGWVLAGNRPLVVP